MRTNPAGGFIERLLGFPVENRPIGSLAEFLGRWRRAAGSGHTVERAAIGGLVADRVGYAFAAGYQAALAALAPEAMAGRVGSLCATEERGAHPRHIATRIEAGALHGRKRWATLGPVADVLLVLASAGLDAQGRNRLRLVRVPTDRPGVAIAAQPPSPFVPEVEHADVRFAAAPITEADLLPGDGWIDYIKPFRTIEDLHVLAALEAHLVGAARARGWPEPLVEELLASLVALRALGDLSPSSAAVHLGLAGAFRSGRRLLAEADPLFAAAEPEVRDRWQRDRALLGVADTARERRRQVAWQRLTATTAPSTDAADTEE